MKEPNTCSKTPTKSIGMLAKEAHGYETMEQLQKNCRLVFPGEPKRESTASLLVDLTTPKQTRPKIACRRQMTNEDITDLLDIEKKVSREEMENIVSRLSRPTYTSSVREMSAHARRGAFEDQQGRQRRAMKKDKKQFDPNRFLGHTKVSKQKMDDIVSRLSRPSARHSQDSKTERQELNRKLGSLCSYRWMGIRNC